MKSKGKTGRAFVLAINGGSSSIKFAFYSMADPPQRSLAGKIERIGLPGTTLTARDPARNRRESRPIQARNHDSAVNELMDWLERQTDFAALEAVGHRVVHGMQYSEPGPITPALLKELYGIRSYAPDHLPREIELIEAFRRRRPDLLQIACFDTAFHRSLPRVARLLPIPRRFDAMGIQRYGFHGLSYAWLMEELAHDEGPAAARGRVVLAHLGNGASLAAVRGGRCLDTSMGFTPAAGVPMGTRPGDLDPGAVSYMMRTERLTPERFNRLINHESGLLGVSETSSDVRDLLERQASDVRAAEAVELFCYQTRKWIGAFAAVLGGLETLVFSGGIGENAPEIRERVCNGLEFLGIELDGAENAANAPVISTRTSPATVRVIRTDEEAMIAKMVCRVLHEEGRDRE